MRLPTEGICQVVRFARIEPNLNIVVHQTWHRSTIAVQLMGVYLPPARLDGDHHDAAFAFIDGVLSEVDRLWLWIPRDAAFLYSYGADTVQGDLFISTDRTLTDLLVDARLAARG